MVRRRADVRRLVAREIGARCHLVEDVLHVVLEALSPAIPAIGAASGYIQAHLKFCAGFGAAGVFNFGELGPTERVANDADRGRDRMRAFQIGFASFAIGIAVGLLAVAVPI